jgi:hypothetical protein
LRILFIQARLQDWNITAFALVVQQFDTATDTSAIQRP